MVGYALHERAGVRAGRDSMKEFKAAAESAAGGDEKKVLEFGLAGQKFVADKATTGQMALVAAAMDEGGTQMVGSVFRFLRGLLHDDGYTRLRNLVANGTVSFDLLVGGDDDNEDGIVDWIIEKSSDDRPPKLPTDYLPSQETGGQRSTGRSPGKGSKRSASVPAAS
jgi:hypothetical protein